VRNKIAKINKDEQKPSIHYGFKEARAITKKHAKSFYFALQFLKKEKRDAVYSVYAICRLIDDAVDESEEYSKEEKLKKIKERIEAAYKKESLKSMLLSSFQQTIHKYNIPKRHFDELLEGMYMDLNKSRYRNFNELFLYCYRVAGVIGLIMIKILGYKHKEAEKYAVDLGVAMQLTNILRDIKEDYRKGRIYLPQDEMRQYGITEKNIAGNFHNKDSNEFLKFQIQRARTYYKNATCVIKLMKDGNARFVVGLMKELYSGILDAIEKNNYNIYKRAYVNKTKKIYLLLKVMSTGDYL